MAITALYSGDPYALMMLGMMSQMQKHGGSGGYGANGLSGSGMNGMSPYGMMGQQGYGQQGFNQGYGQGMYGQNPFGASPIQNIAPGMQLPSAVPGRRRRPDRPVSSPRARMRPGRASRTLSRTRWTTPS